MSVSVSKANELTAIVEPIQFGRQKFRSYGVACTGATLISLNNPLVKFLLVFALLLPSSVLSTVYFVDKSHSSASDSNPGTEASPWLTIQKANTTLTGGDTVFIKAGVYGQGISPTSSGSSGSPITFARYGSHAVEISNVALACNLSSRQWIVVEGLLFKNADEFLRIDGGSNHRIRNCTFGPQRSFATWSGSKIVNNSKYNVISNCVFHSYGDLNGSDDLGSVLEVGNEESSTDTTSYNLIVNCEMYNGGHHVLGLHGNHNIVKGNYLHNYIWSGGFGNRALYTAGYAANTHNNLYEDNRIAWSADPPDNTGAATFMLTTKSNIVRRNLLYRGNLAGLQLSVTDSYYVSPEYNRIYHNTFYTNSLAREGGELDAGITLANYSSSYTFRGNAIKNNIFWQNPNAVATYRVTMSEQIMEGNLLQTANPLFVDITSAQSPGNRTLPDLMLRSGSPAIDAGVALTTITSPSGSGTSFTVGDASYFIDGWGLIAGDRIQILGTSQSATIVAINYSTKTLTCNQSLSWTQNQGVSLAYAGSAPDIGAYEFQNQNAPPSVTSSLTAGGMQGQPFSYQITANNSPTSYAATGLPASLTVAASTGVITGVPQASGVFVTTISASNPYGMGSANLTISISPATPVLRVSQGGLTFAEIGTGQTANLQLWITNSGAGILTGSASATTPFSVVGGASYSLTGGQSWPVTVRYSPTSMGTHGGNVILTGGGGATSPLVGRAFPVFGSWNFPAVGGLVLAPFATNGGYVAQSDLTVGDPTTSGSGRAVYGFTITNAGDYLVSAWVNAIDGGADSFYVNVDAEPVDPTMIWDVPLTLGFERRAISWRGNGVPGGGEFVPKVFALGSGVHKLIIRGREAGAQLQRIEVTDANAGIRPTPPVNLRVVDGD